VPAGEALTDDLRGHTEVRGAAGTAEVGDMAGEVVVRGGRIGDSVWGGDGRSTGGGVGGVGAGLAATEGK